MGKPLFEKPTGTFAAGLWNKLNGELKGAHSIQSPFVIGIVLGQKAPVGDWQTGDRWGQQQIMPAKPGDQTLIDRKCLNLVEKERA